MMTNLVVQTPTRFTYSLIKSCRTTRRMQGPSIYGKAINNYYSSLSQVTTFVHHRRSVFVCIYLCVSLYVYKSLSLSLSSLIILIGRSLHALCSRMTTRPLFMRDSASIWVCVCSMRVCIYDCLKYSFPICMCFTVD